MSDTVRHLIQSLKIRGLETLDIRLLIKHVTGWDAAEQIMRDDENLPRDQRVLLENFAKRRISGEPIDHILGTWDFYGRPFKVTKHVLSPRPETEILTEKILAQNPKRVLDLGTGSGAIIISILAENPSITGVAVDLSEEALKVARENAETHQVLDRLELLQGSWFEPVTGEFDIIVSNPPYITGAAMEELSPEVKNYDPHLALHGGEDGLEAYRTIIAEARKFLTADGQLWFEIGYDQGQSVPKLLKAHQFKNITVFKDYAGHPRIVKARIVQARIVQARIVQACR